MAVPIDHDTIEQLARAVLGQLSSLSGTRATGAVHVVNDTDADIDIDMNSYLWPTVSGATRPELLFKVSPNPATIRPHGQGGAWTVPAHGSAEVGIRSNLGGLRHNLTAGTVFTWDPPLDGLAATVTLNADMTDGANRSSEPRIVAGAYYEGLDSGQVAKDLFGAGVDGLPAVVIVWQQSAPAEGRTAGTNQGSTRLADGARLFAEYLTLYVVVSDLRSDKRRRNNGLRLLQACTRLLSDQQQTNDFEMLTAIGSLEILGRSRYTRTENAYVYALPFRMNRVYPRYDTRVFTPWLKTHIMATLPGRDAPEPTDPITLVDVVDPMPHD